MYRCKDYVASTFRIIYFDDFFDERVQLLGSSGK